MPSSSISIPLGPFILEETPWGGALCLFGNHQVATTPSRLPPCLLEIQNLRNFLPTRCSLSLGARPYATRYLTLYYLTLPRTQMVQCLSSQSREPPLDSILTLCAFPCGRTHSPAQSTPPIDFTDATVKRPSGLNSCDAHGSFAR
jgi:hypothetical protein